MKGMYYNNKGEPDYAGNYYVFGFRDDEKRGVALLNEEDVVKKFGFVPQKDVEVQCGKKYYMLIVVKEFESVEDADVFLHNLL